MTSRPAPPANLPEPAPVPVRTPGRHRLRAPHRRSARTAVEIVGRAGSLITLAALLAVAGSVAGLATAGPGDASAVQSTTLGEPVGR